MKDKCINPLLRRSNKVKIINQYLGSGSTPIPTDGLLLEWLFSGSASDTSGNGNNGSVIGATLTTDRYSVADSAYLFDGSDYITRSGNIPDPTDSNDTFSFCSWVNFSSTNQMRIVSLYSSDSQAQFFIRANSGTIQAFARGTTGEETIVTTVATYNDSNWHFVVGYMNGTTGDVKLWVDNVYKGISSFSGSFTLDDFDLFNVGSINPLQFWIGKIDDVRVYNRELTTGELTALYNE